jgi:hypothetical protein
LFETGLLPNIDDAAPRLPLSSFLLLPGSSLFFFFLRGRFSFFVAFARSLFSLFIAFRNSSQANPVLLGFSAAGSSP